MVHSQNEDFCCKIRALQNELEGLRLDGERRVRQAQDEQIRLARRLADLQSEAGQEVSVVGNSQHSCRFIEDMGK